MPKFKFKVQKEGKYEEGEAIADDKYALTARFRSEAKDVILIEEVKGFSFDTSKFEAAISRVKLQDVILFSRNLAAMIDAGLTLTRALGILEKQTKNPKLKLIIINTGKEINKGVTLSDALAKYPENFSNLYIAMVRVGEESGKLTEALRQITAQLSDGYKLRKKVKGAMMYPSIVIMAMIIVAVLMFIYVVPSLTASFASIGGDLPASTQAIIFISELLADHSMVVLPGMAASMVGLYYSTKTKIGSRVVDLVVIYLPVISKIVKQYNIAMTGRIMSSLLSSGVGVIDSLAITEGVIQNSYYKEVLIEATAGVEKGIPLSETFIKYENLYEPLVGGMITVGEETGQLSNMFGEMAKFYGEEVSQATKDLSTIIEPILMVVVGAGVGFFAVSMITPMYSLMNNI